MRPLVPKGFLSVRQTESFRCLSIYIKPLFFASSINIGWIKGYVQFSTNLSEINIFSISLCNSSNELMSAINNDTTLLFHAFQHTQFLFSQMFQYNHPYLQHIFHHLNLFFCNEHLQVLKVHLQLEQYYLHNKHIVIYYILYPLLISRS